MNQKTLLRYGGWLVTLLTILGIGVVLLPYFWMVSSSLKTGAEVFELPIRWIPQVLQWANYPNALSRGSFGIYFFNSAFVALAVMVGNVLFCSLAGYGLAKFPFPYRTLCFVLILSTLMLPLEIMLVPTYLVARQLGLVNNYGGLIVPLLVDAFGIFLMRQYIKSLPDSRSRRPDWTDAASSASSGASSFPTANRRSARSPCSRSATPGISSSGRSSWRRTTP